MILKRELLFRLDWNQSLILSITTKKNVIGMCFMPRGLQTACARERILPVVLFGLLQFLWQLGFAEHLVMFDRRFPSHFTIRLCAKFVYD